MTYIGSACMITLRKPSALVPKLREAIWRAGKLDFYAQYRAIA